MPGRKYVNGNGYRYGFNGKENDNDISDGGQDYGMRIYDGRLGRFLSVDPLMKKYPWYTPYQFAGNKPIWAADLDGMEEWMKTQENLLRQRVQLQQQVSDAPEREAAKMAAQSLANQPTISLADNSYYAQQRSNAYKADDQYNKAMAGATMDPLAAGMIFPAANAVGQFSKGVVNHAIGAYQGYSQGNFWEGTKNLGLLALDVAPFIPFKGFGAAAGAMIRSSDEIFSASIATRGLAEDFALTTKTFQGFKSANKVIQANNPVYDLFNTSTSTIVDVTTTSAKGMNVSGLYNKLSNLSDLVSPFQNRVLQVYVKEGQYTAEQLSSLSTKLSTYIKDFGLKSSYRITSIK